MVFGVILGVGIAVLGAWMRTTVWARSLAIGKVLGWALIVVAVLSAAMLVMSGSGKSGDAVMAAMTWLIFLVLGSLCAILVALLLGAVQGAFLRKTAGQVALTLSVDLIALALGLLLYQELVHSPALRRAGEESIAWERQRRENEHNQIERTTRRVKEITQQLPPQFRHMSVMELNMRLQAESDRRGHGYPPMDVIPNEVANLVRERSELQNAVPAPVVGPPNRYASITEAEKEFRKGLLASWVAAALLCAPFLRRRA